jgi:DNA-binding transcriptional regulator WhiA
MEEQFNLLFSSQNNFKQNQAIQNIMNHLNQRWSGNESERKDNLKNYLQELEEIMEKFFPEKINSEICE